MTCLTKDDMEYIRTQRGFQAATGLSPSGSGQLVLLSNSIPMPDFLKSVEGTSAEEMPKQTHFHATDQNSNRAPTESVGVFQPHRRNVHRLSNPAEYAGTG